jgi:hypothetical protein
MISLSRVKEATSTFIKVLRYGKSDVQTIEPILPSGIDSKPLKEDLAVHSNTNDRSDPICLGYIWKSDKTQPGELRIFARGTDGSEKLYIYLKNDGTCEFGGNADNLVRFQKLDDELQAFKTKINTELGKIATGITGVGGAYSPTLTTINISAAKISEVKCL